MRSQREASVWAGGKDREPPRGANEKLRYGMSGDSGKVWCAREVGLFLCLSGFYWLLVHSTYITYVCICESVSVCVCFLFVCVGLEGTGERRDLKRLS